MKHTTESMTAVYLKTYVSSSKKRMFLYAITKATPEMLAKFKEIKGEHYAEDAEGRPLFHTSYSTDDQIELIITKNGKIMEDRSEQERLRVKVEQFGGDLGAEMAKLAAAQLFGVSTPASVPHHEFEPEEKEDLNKA